MTYHPKFSNSIGSVSIWNESGIFYGYLTIQYYDYLVYYNRLQYINWSQTKIKSHKNIKQ